MIKQKGNFFFKPVKRSVELCVCCIYRVAQNECNDFYPLFQQHSWLNTIEFCCIGYNVLSQVIWHQVHQVWIRRFDSRAIFLRKCHFQNVLLPPPPPRKQAWSSGNLIFFPLTAPHWINQLCWQEHNCPHFEKEDNMNETEAFITQPCGTIPMIVPQSNAYWMPLFHSCCLPFQSKILQHSAPTYLEDMISVYTPTRTLRSMSDRTLLCIGSWWQMFQYFCF